MTSYKELVKSKEYWLINIQNALFNKVEDYLEDNNMTRSDFASQLNVTKGYVSQILNGEFDFRLSKFVELCLSIGLAPMVELKNIDQFLLDAYRKEETSQKSDYINTEMSSKVDSNFKIIYNPEKETSTLNATATV